MMKILLVDDHVLFREGLASLLGTQVNIEVVGGANTVKEAIEQARDLQPDLILMDYGLPDGTGLEATVAILKERSETKIVFLTVYEDDEHLFAAVRGGAKGFLPKSVPVEELLTYLQRVERGEGAITPAMTGRILDRLSQTEPRRAIPSAVMEILTARELQVLQALESGATNREIASRLVISEQTVKNHVSHILAKLNFKSRHEAAEFARRNRVTDSSFKSER